MIDGKPDGAKTIRAEWFEDAARAFPVSGYTFGSKMGCNFVENVRVKTGCKKFGGGRMSAHTAK